MANLLGKGAAWLNAKRKANAGQLVSYERDGGDRVELQATKGQTDFEQPDVQGFAVQFQSDDWIVSAEDLMLGGRLATPQPGDRIRETVDGVTYIYEVQSPGDEPAYQYSDSTRTTIRIHTKRTDTER